MRSNALSDRPKPPSVYAAAYDRVAIGTHWLVALLVVAVALLGLTIPEMPRGSAGRELVLLLHRSIGLLIFAAMAFRVGWRLFHKPPPLPPSMARIEVFLAHASHVVLYLLFLGMPLTGYVNAAAVGHSVSLFGIVAIPPLLAESARLSQIAIALHLSGQFLVYLFVALHLAAALVHWLVRRDGVIERMLPPRRVG